jgi:hypothetical protein
MKNEDFSLQVVTFVFTNRSYHLCCYQKRCVIYFPHVFQPTVFVLYIVEWYGWAKTKQLSQENRRAGVGTGGILSFGILNVFTVPMSILLVLLFKELSLWNN